MSTFKLPNGAVIVPGNPFVYEEIQYPANWLTHSTSADKSALGLVEVIDDPRPDDRFYFVNADPANAGKWITTPKDLTQIRAMLTDQVNGFVGSTLAQTDWKVTREAEGYKPLDQVMMSYRKALRDAGNALVIEIAALTFDQAVIWQAHDWPAPPT